MSRLICLLLFLLPLGEVATAADPVDNAAEYIRTGNMHELSKLFATDVETAILGNENTDTPAQAETALTTFFKNNPVKSVSVVHRVNSNPTIKFAVLNVVTSTGTYRTSLSFKMVNGQFLMDEIKIEAEKK